MTLVGRDRVVVRPVLPMAPGIHALGLSLGDLGPGPEGILAELDVDLIREAAGDPLGQLSLSQLPFCILRCPDNRSSAGTQDAHDLLDRQIRQLAGDICSLLCGSFAEYGKHEIDGVVRKQQRIQGLSFHQDARAIEAVGVEHLRGGGHQWLSWVLHVEEELTAAQDLECQRCVPAPQQRTEPMRCTGLRDQMMCQVARTEPPGCGRRFPVPTGCHTCKKEHHGGRQ